MGTRKDQGGYRIRTVRPWDLFRSRRNVFAGAQTLPGKARLFRKKLDILASINTGTANWSTFNRFKKAGHFPKCLAVSENEKTYWACPVLF